jgi:Flp pilus assembly protein TadD
MSKRSHQIDAFFRQGQQLHTSGRLAEAEQIYRQVIAASPRHADAIHALGALALQAGRPDAADDLLSQAIGLKPTAEFRLTHVAALTALNRPEDAASLARQITRGNPRNAQAWQMLGHALSDSGQPDAAVDAYRQAVVLQPALPDILNNLGTALRQGGHLEEAETILAQAPPEPFALVNLSSVQKERGRFTEAQATLTRALDLAPNHPVLRYNHALLLLLLGRDSDAWPGWEQRFAANAIPARHVNQPQWDGTPLRGRTLLVHAEQGFGDTLQFCRFLPALDGGDILFEAPAPLVRLLSSNPAMPRVVAEGGVPAAIDCVSPLLSLPARGVQPPPETPYLFAEPDRVARWRSRIGDHGLRVGVAWQGNSARHEDKGRSFPLELYRPLADIAGVRLISLQKGEGTEQIPRATFPIERLDDLDVGPDAFLDTAAVMASLDLVVTSDTSIAHLAGALGRPVWVALRRVPDWRFLLDRTDSPWYPTMRLFRQELDGDWAPVFRSIAAELSRLVRP